MSLSGDQFVAGHRPLVSATSADVQAAAAVSAAAHETVDAKVGLASTQGAAVGSVASALKSVKQQDGVQLTADALKLSADTLAKNTSAAPHLAGASNVITGLNKAADGDAFGAASAAAAAANQLAPALGKSGVGAIASAVVLGTGDGEIKKQATVMRDSLAHVFGAHEGGAQRVKAVVDLTVALQNLLGLGRTLVLAGLNVGKYGLKLMTRSAKLAPAATKVESSAKVVP